MPAILRASVSLDGKLLTSDGKPSRRGVPAVHLRSARKLVLTIHPVIEGDVSLPSLSGLPGAFLPEGSEWELLSVAKGEGAQVTVRYGRRLREALP